MPVPVGGVTVRLTATVSGLFEADGAVITMLPEYCPAASVAGPTVTESAAGVAPEDGVTFSQLPPEAVEVVIEKLAEPPWLVIEAVTGLGGVEPD
jgi:hypothetical protein